MLISLFVAGVLLGLIFWKLEKRNTDPLISPSLVKDPDFRSGLAASFIVTVLFSGVMYLMPLYLLNSHHLDTFTSGMIMTVPALLSFIVSSHAGNFADRYGTRRISMFAVAVAAVGFLVFLTYNPTTILVVIIIGMLVTRVSTSVFCGPNGNLTMNHCPGGAVGNGYGVTMVIRYVGSIIVILTPTWGQVSVDVQSNQMITVPATFVPGSGTIPVSTRAGLSVVIIFIAIATGSVILSVRPRK